MSNGNTMLLGLVGIAAGAGITYLVLRDRETEDDSSLPGGRVGRRPAPQSPSQLPPPPVAPGSNNTTVVLPPVPPSTVPIPGGTQIQGIGWCPPGYAYNLATGQCEWDMPLPQLVLTTGDQTGACCAACAVGDECEGCDNG